jgi:hypothetical protein
MTLEEQKTQLSELVKQLTALGEDGGELDFWLEIFDTMDESQRIKLLDNLSVELTQLKSLEK